MQEVWKGIYPLDMLFSAQNWWSGHLDWRGMTMWRDRLKPEAGMNNVFNRRR